MIKVNVEIVLNAEIFRDFPFILIFQEEVDHVSGKFINVMLTFIYFYV